MASFRLVVVLGSFWVVASFSTAERFKCLLFTTVKIHTMVRIIKKQNNSCQKLSQAFFIIFKYISAAKNLSQAFFIVLKDLSAAKNCLKNFLKFSKIFQLPKIVSRIFHNFQRSFSCQKRPERASLMIYLKLLVNLKNFFSKKNSLIQL